MQNFNEIEVFKNAELSNFCTFKIGGKAKYLFVVYSGKQLEKVYLHCKTHNIQVKVIGLGANLLFDDSGFDGAIIVNKTDKILFRKNCVWVDSGVAVSALISACEARGLGGIEKLVGIPSTVGGAVVNGLGAFGVEFNNFVEYVVCLDENGRRFKLKNSACKFGYRTSIFKEKNFVILRVKLRLNFCDGKTIKSNMIFAAKQKSASQPLDYPSAGSVFKRFYIDENTKRREIVPAKIIDGLGLKGLAVGGAMVSPKHAGFIINTGKASSKDVKSLIGLINQKVQAAYGFALPLEIEIVK